MNDKRQLLTKLREELNRWEDALGRMNEEQLTAPQPDSDLSIKDVIGHLRAWQQVSIARMEAALHNREPEFPAWLMGQHPESDENRDEYNARIHAIYRDQPWSSVHRQWREGFLRFLELAEAVPEAALFDAERYPWLEGYALSAVLEGSYEHHEEHREQLRV